MKTYFIPNALGRAVLRITLAILIVAVVSLLFVGLTLAQETPEMPDIPVPPVEEAGALLTAAIVSILIGLINSPVTTAAVAVLKRLPFLTGVRSETMQTSVAALIAVVYWLAVHFGFGIEFQQAWALLLAIAPTLGGMLANQYASTAIYESSKSRNVPFWGYERPYNPARYKEAHG